MVDEIQDDKADVTEQYMTSVGSSNLRVGNDSKLRTPGDMVAAAGMSKHTFGLLLERLQAEWDCAKKPPRLTVKKIEDLAATFKRLPNSPLTRYMVRLDGKDTERDVLPIVAAQFEADRWHANEMSLLFLRLKSLPAVRRVLIAKAQAEGWESGIHLVAALLEWWLDRTCPACEGRKFRLVVGTGRTSSKPCPKCKPSPDALEGTGERKVPHGWQGRKMLAYINACRGTAARDLREGQGAERSAVNLDKRAEEFARQDRERLVRVDAEVAADQGSDTEATRAAFALGTFKSRTKG